MGVAQQRAEQKKQGAKKRCEWGHEVWGIEFWAVSESSIYSIQGGSGTGRRVFCGVHARKKRHSMVALQRGSC